MDSGFPKRLDSNFFSVGLQIPVVSGIPNSKAQVACEQALPLKGLVTSQDS